jgi:O-antigen/teichoic acid export membrane protein
MLDRRYGQEESAPQRLLGRASLAGIGSASQLGLFFLTGVVTARVLGAAGYGVLNLARALIDNTAVITRLGLDLGLQRFFGETNTGAGHAARAQVLRQVRVVTALVATVPVLAVALGLGRVLETHVYLHADFGRILLCMALALPFISDIAVLGGAYRGVLKLGPAVLAEGILLPLGRLLFILLLFAAGWGLWAVAVGGTLAAVLGSMWLALRARRDFMAAPAPSGSWTAARRVIGYSGVLAMAVLVTMLTSTMDLLMLGHFVRATELGQYALAKQLLVLTTLVSVAFNQSMGGVIADRHFSGDRAGMLRVLAQIFRWIALATLPLFVVFLLWGAPLLSLFGPSFAIAQPVVAWLATGQLIVALFGPMGWALSMTGRHLLEVTALLCGLVLAVILCRLAIPVWGQLGAAVATCAAIAATNLLRLLCVRRSFGAVPVEGRTWLIMAGGLGIGLAIKLLVVQSPLSALAQAVLGIACFLACYAVLCRSHLRGAFSMIKRPAVAGHG